MNSSDVMSVVVWKDARKEAPNDTELILVVRDMNIVEVGIYSISKIYLPMADKLVGWCEVNWWAYMPEVPGKRTERDG